MTQADGPIASELLDILRCPVAVHFKDKGADPGRLELVQRPNGDWWLTCADSGCKYPVRDGIPVMLVEVGEKYRDVLVEQLPVIADEFTD
jgi:uncharacterized protein YbaR (Trm112 family)